MHHKLIQQKLRINYILQIPFSKYLPCITRSYNESRFIFKSQNFNFHSHSTSYFSYILSVFRINLSFDYQF